MNTTAWESFKQTHASRFLLAGLCTVVAIAYWAHPKGEFSTGGLVHGDGLYHYALLRSLFFDGDFDLGNDYQLLGNPYRYGLGPMGIPVNRFSLGPALIWAPFLFVAHCLASLGNFMGWMTDDLNGCSAFYQRIALLGSPVAGVMTVVLGYREVLRRYGRETAIFASSALVGATPWFWYVVYQPSYSHAASGFSMAVVVWLCLRLQASESLRAWFLLGVAVGIAMLVRAQNIIVFILPVSIWIGRILACTCWSFSRSSVKKRVEIQVYHPWYRYFYQIGLMLLGTILAFSPQMIMWNAIYDQPLLIPQGSGFMHWDASKWSSVLWSTRNGLFAFHPMLLAAIVATLYAGMKGRLSRLQWIGLALFAGQAYINGAAYDWWAGWSYGGRRFLGLSCFFCLFFASLWPKTRQKQGAVVLGLTAATWLNVGMMHDYFYRLIQPSRSVAMAPVWSRWFGTWTRPVHAYLGHPGSWPANWWFAIKGGVQPGVFDRVSGQELARFKGFERGRQRVNLHRFGIRGLKQIEEGPSPSPKWIVAKSMGRPLVIALPLRRAYAGNLSVRVVASRAEDILLEYNGEELPAVSINSGTNRIRVNLPQDDSLPGINLLHIKAEQPLLWSHPVLKVK